MFTKEVLLALETLNNHGYEAYVVGGAVRDFLLCNEIHDYDITTSALPEQIEAVFKDYKVFNTNKRFGTITVIINHLPLEITTYRKDEEYDDHRKPNNLTFTSSLNEDVIRRDFTINCLLMNKDMQVIDLVNGKADLDNHLIRAVGNPIKRFEEDALRILRAIRFKAQLNFEIDQETDEALFKQAKLLDYISSERKRDELLKILTFNNLKVLSDYQIILNRFIPYDNLNPLIAKTNNIYIKLYLLNPNFDYRKLHLPNDDIKIINEIKHYDSTNLIETMANAKHLDILFEYFKLIDEVDYHQFYLDNKDYIVNMQTLNINGNDLENLGLKGPSIGKMFKLVLKAIHNKVIHNDYDEIINYTKVKIHEENIL